MNIEPYNDIHGNEMTVVFVYAKLSVSCFLCTLSAKWDHKQTVITSITFIL